MVRVYEIYIKLSAVNNLLNAGWCGPPLSFVIDSKLACPSEEEIEFSLIRPH